MIAVKQNLRPVSTTTNKAFYIDTKEMPRNCRKLSGMPKTQEQIPPSNGASRQKLVHINREQNRATSVLQRNSLLYNPTPPQRSIKNQSLTTNAATKTSSNWQVLLRSFAYRMWCLMRFRSRRVTLPLSRILLMQCPPGMRFLAILHLFTYKQPAFYNNAWCRFSPSRLFRSVRKRGVRIVQSSLSLIYVHFHIYILSFIWFHLMSLLAKQSVVVFNWFRCSLIKYFCSNVCYWALLPADWDEFWYIYI